MIISGTVCVLLFFIEARICYALRNGGVSVRGMKTGKRIAAWLLAFALTAGALAGCGGTAGEGGAADSIADGGGAAGRKPRHCYGALCGEGCGAERQRPH